MNDSVKYKKALFWFRRDLRLEDNKGLFYALTQSEQVAPIFIFDKAILDDLPVADKKIAFIWQSLLSLKEQLKDIGSDLIVKFGYAQKEIVKLANQYQVECVYTNEDYEPTSRQRDALVQEELQKNNIEFKFFTDQVIFSPQDILTPQKKPFITFSHYRQAWRKKITVKDYEAYSSENYLENFVKFTGTHFFSLEELGFDSSVLNELKLQANNQGAVNLFERFKNKVLNVYKTSREIPSISGVSYLSLYNRYGLISVRYLVKQSFIYYQNADEKKKEHIQAWIDELIAREFFMQIMFHYPHIVHEPFNHIMNDFEWENNPVYFQAWCDGKTGYPLIDAAMIHLNKSGYMHNKLRRLVSSFLTKYLLIDYRMGEFYFANTLLDYELSSNNGGWQWSASSGAEAQSYNKIFSPIKQSEKYDLEAIFIKKHLPIFKNIPSMYLHEPWNYVDELSQLGINLGDDYPLPIIDFKERKDLSLKLFHDQFNK